jgi:hypothetical protein
MRTKLVLLALVAAAIGATAPAASAKCDPNAGPVECVRRCGVVVLTGGTCKQ